MFLKKLFSSEMASTTFCSAIAKFNAAIGFHKSLSNFPYEEVPYLGFNYLKFSLKVFSININNL